MTEIVLELKTKSNLLIFRIYDRDSLVSSRYAASACWCESYMPLVNPWLCFYASANYTDVIYNLNNCIIGMKEQLDSIIKDLPFTNYTNNNINKRAINFGDI